MALKLYNSEQFHI